MSNKRKPISSLCKFSAIVLTVGTMSAIGFIQPAGAASSPIGHVADASAGPVPTAEITGSRFVINGNGAARLSVRIMGPNGTMYQDGVVETGSFYWSPQGPDGTYRFEATALPGPAPAPSSARPNSASTKPAARVWGNFRVEGGVIERANQSKASNPQASAREIGFLEWVAGTMLKNLVPTASAADVTSESTRPKVLFDDTGDEDCSPDFDWLLWTEGGSTDSDTDNQFQLRAAPEDLGSGCPGGAVNILDITYSGEPDFTDASAWNSMVVSGNGNMSLANGDLFIDRSLGKVGVGTTTPADDFEILASSTPFLQITETSGSTNLGITFSHGSVGEKFLFMNPDGDVTFLDADTPNITWQDATGNLGVGTTNPSTALHVQRSSGTARVLVDEQSGTAANRSLFEISNNGGAAFVTEDRSAGSRYSFANVNGNFVINKQGEGPKLIVTGSNTFRVQNKDSGAELMKVSSGGNLRISGTLTEGSSRALKKNIEPVDESEVLAKLDELELSEWQYKKGTESRHMGPMAEDFHRVYQLGQGPKTLAPKDMAGVAMASAKALKDELEEKEQRIEELEAKATQVDELQAEQKVMKAELDRLKQLVEETR